MHTIADGTKRKTPSMCDMRPEDLRHVNDAFVQLADEWAGADKATISDMILEAWSPNATFGGLVRRVRENIAFVTAST